MLENLLTEKEVMGLLKISPSTLYRLRKQKVDPLPFLKIGGGYRYDGAQIRRWMERQAQRAMKAG